MSRTPQRTLGKVLICKACGTHAVIQRRVTRDRSAGHVKTMWCWKCRQIREHVEQAA